MTGETILHYKIMDKLGEGGMGVVYKAEDVKLKREVAIKFLPRHISVDEDEHRRFEIEAQAAASLNHPNIATIYTVEEDNNEMFIVMELVDGVELKDKIKSGPIKLDESINIATQIAEGLEEAHKKGIVHRDIKSQNVMITKEDKVKIMDFGLAKIGRGINLTKSGTTFGTMSYMSPEQIYGKEADARSDIWSFGVVLYEMLCGHLPFEAEYEQAIAYSIVNSEAGSLPEELDCPSYLKNIVAKCLQKDPNNRYQNVSDFLKDLKTGNAPEIKSSRYRAKKTFNLHSTKNQLILAFLLLLILFIAFVEHKPFIESIFGPKEIIETPHLAVLPVSDIGGDKSNQAFCNGLTEILTSNLTQLQQLHDSIWVVPISEILKNNIQSPGQANQFFGANLVVTGSLMQIDDSFRLTLNLIDAKRLRQLNSFVVDVKENKLALLQNRSIISVLKMLNLQLNPKLKGLLEAGNTNDPEAYEYYIQGRGFLQSKENFSEVESAINSFLIAIQRDSLYALAHAGLAQAYWEKYLLVKKNELAQKAVKEAKRAYELNSKLAYVNIVLGNIHDGTGKYKEAVDDFNRALGIDPVSYEAYQGLAKAYENQSLPDDAERTYENAISMQPSNWIGYHSLGVFYCNHARYNEAIVQFRKEIQLNPQNYLGLNGLGAAYYYTNKLNDAIKTFEKAFDIKQTYFLASNLGTVYYILGKYAEAAEKYKKALSINDHDYTMWGNLATAYYWAPGERDKADSAYWQAIRLGEKDKEVNPNNAQLITMLAGYYAMVHQKEKALEYVKKSVRLAPHDAETMFRAGATYEQLGDRREAIDWIIKSIKNGYPRSDIESQPELKNLIFDKNYLQWVSKINKSNEN